MGLTVVGSIAFDRGQDARSASASACSAARPPTSRSRRRSSTPSPSSARSATTSARSTSTSCARAGRTSSDIERVPGGRDVLLARRVRLGPQLSARPSTPSWASSPTFEPKLSPASRAATCSSSRTSSRRCSSPCASQCTRARFVALDSMNFWIDERPRRARRRDPAGRLRPSERRGAAPADRPAEPRRGGARGLQLLGPRVVVAKQGEYGACADHARLVLLAAGVPARDGGRPDRRRRHVRRRVRRLSSHGTWRARPDRRRAAAGDGVRDGARVLQRRGVRHRPRRRG